MIYRRTFQYTSKCATSFVLNNAKLEIDHWPMIAPYVEIEADSKEHVIETAQLLGYQEEQLTGENTVKIYARYGVDLDNISDLRFS
jgi:adenylate cyclase class 2